MSESDLSEIAPPVKPPSDLPDEKTKAEALQLAKKAATPTERETASHLAHLETHRVRIAHHCSEVAELKGQLQQVRGRLEESQLATGQRDARIRELETAKRYGGCLSVLGTVATLIGACFGCVAGGTPIPDVWKVALVAAAVVMTLTGALIVFSVAWLGRR